MERNKKGCRMWNHADCKLQNSKFKPLYQREEREERRKKRKKEKRDREIER
jgi:hypothetical protein